MSHGKFHSKPVNLLIHNQKYQLGIGLPNLIFVLLSLGLVILLVFNWVSAVSAQGGAGFIRDVRTIETNELDIHNPVGLAYSPQANIFYVIEANATNESSIITMSPFEELIDSSIVNTSLIDPINMAFNNLESSLLLLDMGSKELIEIHADADGYLDTDSSTFNRYPIDQLGLNDPQGMTVDPSDGTLYVLDSQNNEIVQIKADNLGGFSNLVLSSGSRISRLDLSQLGLSSVRGLAINPLDGTLYVYSPSEKLIYQLSWSGQVVEAFDISPFNLSDPQGLTFALSGDLTDDPDNWNLHIADSGIDYLESRESILTLNNQSSPLSPAEAPFKVYLPMSVKPEVKKNNPQLGLGRVFEFTFSPPAQQTLAADFNSTVVEIVDTANYNPPSPDPSGIAYISSSNRLVMCDGEVEETVGGTTHFEDVNVWETTLTGNVTDTANISKVGQTIINMSNEPTGVAWDPISGDYFFSDDNAKEVFILDPGNDNRIGTNDDTWTSFDTQSNQSEDPEGIAFDTINDRIFVADGVNEQIYEYDLNGNLINDFDVGRYGITDPEAVEYNATSDTLFVMSSRRVVGLIAEVTRSGSLIQTIDFSDANGDTPAGLTYAPASDGSGAMRFYIVDRAVDNNSDPNLIDGLMYEMTAPGSSNVAPVANDDNANTATEVPVVIDVANNDSDSNGNLDPTSTNTSCPGCSTTSDGNLVNHGDGTFTYTSDAGFTGTDNFVYEICDTDGLCDTATATISVTPPNDPPTANNDPNEATNEDTLGTFNVSSNDTDPNSNLDLTSTNTSCATCTIPAHGTLINNGDGSFDYDPILNFNGTDGFVYEICDTFNACDTASVTITVDPIADPPSATDDLASTVETNPVLINVAFNDSDPDGDLDPTSANNSCPSCSGPNSGSVNNNGDGTFTYTANSGFTGTDTFVYEICDSGNPSQCDNASVDVTVSEQLFVETIYISSNSGGTAGGVAFKDEDIMAFDYATGTWAMHFDGSDVGLGATGDEVDGVHVNPDGSILLSLTAAASLPDVGSIEDIDIVRFIPTSVGEVTSGTYEMYFDGSDTGLAPDGGEDVAALALAPDGSIIVSTRGVYSVGGLSGDDVDLLKFTPTSLGTNTSGTWSTYFDGSDVGLGDGTNEDLNALWVDVNEDVYLSSRDAFSVPGASGDFSDIYTCEPGSLGENTACTFLLFWDGSANGFGGENINGLSIVTTGGSSDNNPPSLVNNTGSSVQEGGTDPIPNTELRYDDAQPPSSVTYTVTTPPTNGQLDLTGGPPPPVNSFSQADIDAGYRCRLVGLHPRW
jgi:uncharacterized protein YjiK